MKVKVARSDTYIPRWRGNRDLPEDEQVKVEYSYMTAEQEEKYSTLIPRYKGNEGANIDVEVEIHTNANAIWCDCVNKVYNFFWDDGKGEKEYTSPREVLKVPGIYGLVTEVVGHIKKGIDEKEIKN